MPTYEYACTNAECGNRFDLVQSFSDPSATECPVCGQPVRKVYGAVGVVFKGSGFYRNDSRESDGRKASAASASSGDAPAKSTEKSGDKVAASSSSGDSSSSSSDSSGGSTSASTSTASSSKSSGSTSTSTPAAKSA